VFTKRRILLVSLAKGTLGAEAAQLLGSIVVSQLWQAALGRVAIAASDREPVLIHIDEFQDYLRLSGDIKDALAQARGLGVGFTLAHQHLGQLTPSLQKAISANTRSRVAFALSPEDARDLARTTHGLLESEDYVSLHAYQAYAHVLADGVVQSPVSIATSPLPESLRRPDAVLAASRTRWGRPLDEIEADLLNIAMGDVQGRPSDAPGDPGGVPGPGAERLGRVRRPTRTNTTHNPKGGTP